ncbi:MAG TPA: MurT ligase domain-containing protein [Patescibacteria group bacterium]|nr:MurT ligase domain-containing protein [Patescibacteria group bacterium]
MNYLLILLGKLVLWISKTFNLGSGSTWPGHVAMETNPRFVKQVLKKNPNLKVVLVAGTNGKTTTSLMLRKILEEAGLKVFQNEAGANLLNGIASTVITNCSLFGKIKYDVAIFEVDERNVSLTLKEINPYAIMLLNIFRDQLDRYGEVNQVIGDWQEALGKLDSKTILVTNGDDPELTYVAQKSKLTSYYFGVEEKLMTQGLNPRSKNQDLKTDTDFTYCPNCQTKLKYSKISFSHMGRFSCPKCKLTNPETKTFPTLPHPLLGLYNIYNTNAAVLLASIAFNVGKDTVHKALEDFKPAFGRQETIKYKNREVIMLLSKNPAGFNQSIGAMIDSKKEGNVLLLLNDRIPDGRDVSWIWDVDFENIPKQYEIFISGDRAYDMGLRIKYLGDRKLDTNIFQGLENSIDQAIAATKPEETLFIFPTYSAMLEARKILTGKAIL